MTSCRPSARRIADVADGVTQADLDADELTFGRAKDKSDKSLEAYKFFVNSLYVAVTRAVETVYIVESDPNHPLLGLLRITFSEDVSSFSAKASSIEEWQKEARRLELQGKDEQADAIRRTILKTTPVPWTVLHGAGFDDIFTKALAPRSVFGKAKQQLFELGAFHELAPITRAVEQRPDYTPPRPYAEMMAATHERLLTSSRSTDHGRIFDDVNKYGLEHRNMMSLTPLMTAAWTGNVPLVEALLDRGARTDAVDVFGRMPLHFALRSALRDTKFAAPSLGALYELLCPTGLDIECDGRLVRIARNQGEFFVLAIMLAQIHSLYDRFGVRRGGFAATMLSGPAIEAFPRSVLSDERRKRTYWNAVLARAEEDSTYRPTRRLWRRERQGNYVPSRTTRLRVTDEKGIESFRSIAELVRLSMLDELGQATYR